MFTLALLIGIYAYTVFLLGLLGMLYWPIIVVVTLLYIGGNIYYFRLSKFSLYVATQNIKHTLFHKKIFSFFLWIVILQGLINFIGALGPEISFDALWYHLTFPKLYLDYHTIVHIPGGLLYYSDMPKLIELLYTGALSFHWTILPKLFHFGFGILTCFALYRLARRWFSPVLSLLVVIIFYTNLVVGWESIAAYIDLGRTFFEVLALWAFFLWTEEKKRKWFYISAIMVGFAMASKIIAFPSLIILSFLIYYIERKHTPFSKRCKLVIIYILTALTVPLPWFMFSVIHTGNPLYPLFDPIIGNAGSAGWQLLNPLYFLKTFWTLFTHAADPISPWYVMILPLVIVFYKKAPIQLKLIYWYCGLTLFFWYITPNTGGGRFILPYLPVLSILSVYPLALVQKKQQKLFIGLIVALAIISITYRGIANWKFIPVVIHRESASTFLAQHLNFSYGDFYDTDGYFKTHIKSTDIVLLYGFHNLYYVDFPFIDSSWVTTGDVFNYIAVQNGAVPKRFQHWTLVYTNPVTHVSLYSAGGIPWTY